MKLSIIIPVYNTEAYLEDCLASIPSRDGVELILVDDGSQKLCATLCDQLASQRSDVRVIHQANQGLSEARNAGVREARGDYLFFLDSDDSIDCSLYDACLEQVERAQAPLYLLSYASARPREAYRPEEAQADFAKRFYPQGQSPSHALSLDDFHRFVEAHEDHYFLVAVRFIVQRTLFLQEQLWFRKDLYHEDEEWAHRLLTLPLTWLPVPGCLYLYRLGREGSITATTTAKHLDSRYQITQLQVERLKQLNEGSSAHQFLSSRIAHNLLALLWNAPLLSETQRKSLSKQSDLRSHLKANRTQVLLRRVWSVIGFGGLSRCLQLYKRLRR